MSNDQSYSDEPSVRAPKPDPQASPAAPDQQRQPDNHTAAFVSVRVPNDNKETAAAARQDTGVAVLRQAALLPDERLEDFDELRAAIFAATKPADVIEEIWIGDCCALVWQIYRERRLGNALQSATAIDVLNETLLRYWREENVPGLGNLGWRWGSKDPKAVGQVRGMLQQIGLSTDHILALAMSRNIEHLERLDRLAANKSLRRDNIFRELERRRATAQERPRREEPEDAEFELVEPNSPVMLPIAPRTANEVSELTTAVLDADRPAEATHGRDGSSGETPPSMDAESTAPERSAEETASTDEASRNG